jgi:hypothetical protein
VTWLVLTEIWFFWRQYSVITFGPNREKLPGGYRNFYDNNYKREMPTKFWPEDLKGPFGISMRRYVEYIKVGLKRTWLEDVGCIHSARNRDQ